MKESKLRAARCSQPYYRRCARGYSADKILNSSPKTEAISAALTDRDAGPATLSQRCDKTRTLKQGMVQELLNGRMQLI